MLSNDYDRIMVGYIFQLFTEVAMLDIDIQF